MGVLGVPGSQGGGQGDQGRVQAVQGDDQGQNCTTSRSSNYNMLEQSVNEQYLGTNQFPPQGDGQQVPVGGQFVWGDNGLGEQCGGQTITSVDNKFGHSSVVEGYIQGENQVLLEQEQVGLGGYQGGSLSARSSSDLFMRRGSSSWDFLGPTLSSPSTTSDQYSGPYHSSSVSSWSPQWVWQVGTSPQCAPAYCGQCGLWGSMSLVRLG